MLIQLGGGIIKSADIAKLANVSRATVSRVINNYDNVPEETRRKVQAVIDEHGYTPNQAARSLVGKESNIIGIFLADFNQKDTISNSNWLGLNSPYNIDILTHLISICKQNNYLTLVNIINSPNECEDMEVHFSNKMLFGGIFIGFPYHLMELKKLAEKSYNIVLVDHLLDSDDKENKIKRVNTNNFEGGVLATEYLINKGHKNILHITGDDRLSSIERLRGFQYVTDKNSDIKSNIIIGKYREDIAYEKMREYLEKDIPSAIFIANDIMALGVIKAIKEKGLSIPNDISIISFDDLNSSEWVDLNLTTVNAPRLEVAQNCVDLLLSNKVSNHTLIPNLIPRSTVRQIV